MINQNSLSRSDIENTLYHLNYRWNMEALSLWKGDKAPFTAYEIYEGYDSFINLDTLAAIDALPGATGKRRLRFALIDHYLQRALLPHENEMRAWTRGAAAHVSGEKIYFRDIITWCQKSSTYEKRQILQKESGPLCKFLKPFALNYWNILIEMLSNDLGFENYIQYCSEKKALDYSYYYEALKKLLLTTDTLYFDAMEKWCRKRFGIPLADLTRFDSINILSLREFDGLFPEKPLGELTPFFRHWDMDTDHIPGLNIDIEKEKGKSAQGICFVLQAPDEITILMRPEGGWIDLETLWHELGHGFSAAYTSSDLSFAEKDMATSFSLSEAFAFLNQNLALSVPFLTKQLGLHAKEAEDLTYHKVLKDFSMFRRYAAKFIAEYEMFMGGDLTSGEPYARTMARYTGFYYQPESHLFDLVPELYCLDYILGWMGEAVMESHLREVLGKRWMFTKEAGIILKGWWSQGNRDDLPAFLERNGLTEMSMEIMVKKWERALG